MLNSKTLIFLIILIAAPTIYIAVSKQDGGCVYEQARLHPALAHRIPSESQKADDLILEAGEAQSQGCFEEAQTLLRQARDIHKALGNVTGHGYAEEKLAKLYREWPGKLDLVDERLHAALNIYNAASRLDNASTVHYILANVAQFERGDYPKARHNLTLADQALRAHLATSSISPEDYDKPLIGQNSLLDHVQLADLQGYRADISIELGNLDQAAIYRRDTVKQLLALLDKYQSTFNRMKRHFPTYAAARSAHEKIEENFDTMTDAEMDQLTHLQSVSEDYHNITQSLFNAAFLMKYLGEKQKRVGNTEAACALFQDAEKLYQDHDESWFEMDTLKFTKAAAESMEEVGCKKDM